MEDTIAFICAYLIHCSAPDHSLGVDKASAFLERECTVSAGGSYLPTSIGMASLC